MSAGLNENDYLATLRGLWEKAWPKGMPRSPTYLHGEVPLTEYLRAWCAERMAVYKVPEVRIIEALPLTATGKVKKQDLNPNQPPAAV